MAGRKAKTATAAGRKAPAKATPRIKPKAKTPKAKTPKAKTKPKVTAKVSAKPRSAAKAAPKTAAKSKPAKPTSRGGKPRPVKAVDKVVAAARTAKKAAAAHPGPAGLKIIGELEKLAKYIRAAKREIAAIRPDDVKQEYLPKAADELDAVVEATAEATNAIMDSCEMVEGVMGEVSDAVSAKLMDATTRIYEACTFQDITGQRIGKVVNAMKHIEERIDALMDAFGGKSAPAKPKPAPRKAGGKAAEKKVITDADLLEGPQLGDKAKSQAEIDALLASFD